LNIVEPKKTILMRCGIVEVCVLLDRPMLNGRPHTHTHTHTHTHIQHG